MPAPSPIKLSAREAEILTAASRILEGLQHDAGQAVCYGQPLHKAPAIDVYRAGATGEAAGRAADAIVEFVIIMSTYHADLEATRVFNSMMMREPERREDVNADTETDDDE